MNLRNSESWLNLNRTVRFGETDSAGVIHFYQVLKWCHESWEESLEIYGVNLKEIFPKINCENKSTFSVLLPIVYCDAGFLKPISTGDNLKVCLHPKFINSSEFEIKTTFFREEMYVAYGMLRHVALDSLSMSKSSIPKIISDWVSDSS